MGKILWKILTNTISMRKFKNLIVSLKTLLFNNKRVHLVEVPNTCVSRAEKKQIIKATIYFLEHNIIIN